MFALSPLTHDAGDFCFVILLSLSSLRPLRSLLLQSSAGAFPSSASSVSSSEADMIQFFKNRLNLELMFEHK